MPTWGSVQSAQDTLDKSRGNAHDIASLSPSPCCTPAASPRATSGAPSSCPPTRR
nr:hypothetical protein [Xylophilus sp. Leaf220]